MADFIADVAVGGVEFGEFGGVGVDVGEKEFGFVEGADDVEDVNRWQLTCSIVSRRAAMKTVAEWVKKHPRVKVRMFERNYKKQSGSGKFEAVCEFCLASYYFTTRLRRSCRFCLAPFRKARSISALPEILSQRWRVI